MRHALPDTSLFRVRMPPVLPRPEPTQPTLIRQAPDKPLQFTSLDQLARHIHAQRAGGGVEIEREGRAHLPSTREFRGFNIYTLEEDSQARRWIGFAAIQGRTFEALQDALRRTEERAAA